MRDGVSQMFLQTDKLFVGAVGSLTDGADDVVRRSLAVLAEICSCQPAAAAAQPSKLLDNP